MLTTLTRRVQSLLLLCALSVARAQAPPSAQVQQWMQLGSDAMRQGRPADALKLFSQAAAAAPQLPDAFLGLGLAQLRAGEGEQAQTTLRHAIELDPHTLGAHLFLGIAQYQGGDAAAAAASIQQELDMKPDNVEALTWLGIVDLNAGNLEAAAAPLDRAAALSPKSPEILYYRGRVHARIAEDSYRALYKLDPNAAIVHRALGESLSASGQSEKAIVEYETALRKQPGDADLYELLADEDQKLSRFDAAAAAYQQELKINPDAAIALYNLGKIDVERGKPAEGVPLLAHAVELHASPAPTQYYLGFGLAALGRNQEAAKALEASLAAQPSDFIAQSAWYQLGRVYQRLGRAAEAQHAFTQVQQLKEAAAAPANPEP